MIIKYEFLSKLTDEVSEVEVSEELGRAMVEMEKDDFNNDRRETRRHTAVSAQTKRNRRAATKRRSTTTPKKSVKIPSGRWRAYSQMRVSRVLRRRNAPNSSTSVYISVVETLA